MNNIEFLFIWTFTIDKKKLYMVLFPSLQSIKKVT